MDIVALPTMGDGHNTARLLVQIYNLYPYLHLYLYLHIYLYLHLSISISSNLGVEMPPCSCKGEFPRKVWSGRRREGGRTGNLDAFIIPSAAAQITFAPTLYVTRFLREMRERERERDGGSEMEKICCEFRFHLGLLGIASSPLCNET